MIDSFLLKAGDAQLHDKILENASLQAELDRALEEAPAHAAQERVVHVRLARVGEALDVGPARRPAAGAVAAERRALGVASLPDRDRFMKAGKEFAAAGKLLDEVREQQKKGPPACFTIGCTTNFESGLWRYNAADDYTGPGLEKPDAILKPPGFKFEDK